MRRTLVVAALGAALSPVVLAAQAHCKPASTSNEAKLLALFAGPLTFAQQGRVDRLPAGAIVLAGDVTWVPQPSAAMNRSTGACGFQKAEHTGLSSFFPRPRMILGLGGGVSLEASYLPPVTVAEATPNLGGVALAWASATPSLPGGLDFSLRAHATFGHVRGPVTCPRDALQTTSAGQACYGSIPSNDSYEPNVRGVEAAVAQGAGPVSWYAGAGVASLSPHFQVDFTDQGGFRDLNTIDVTLTRVTLFAGGSWKWSQDVSLSGQIYSVPEDATTGRLGIAWRLR